MASDPSSSSTRDRIIAAAIEVFEADGIRGTSLERVADAAGVHRVTLHRIFSGGRDQLVAEVLIARAVQVLVRSLASADDDRSTSELIVATFTSFVMLARADRLIHEGICSDAAQLALAPERSSRLYELTITWGARIAPAAARDRIEFVTSPERITDLLARTLITLVREPGIVATEDDVRAYLADFIVPAITRPLPERPA